MAITVYPPPATTSSSAAATTTDSTKYSWGTPKLGVCMQLTSECSNLCLCFCCRDLTAIANGATSCQTVNMSWRVFPFGDNCVVVLRSSCWNLVGQVFAISDSGAITSKGTCCELFNWMCEWSCCSPSCCYNYGPQTASCCIKNELCRTEGTDAAGRLYALLSYRTNGCNCSGYYDCAHVKSFCYDDTSNAWTDVCTYKNSTGSYSNPECATYAMISNPAKGFVSVRSHYCNCTGSNCYCTRYFVHGQHCVLNAHCTGCTTTYCQNMPAYFARYGDNNFYAMYHCCLINGRQPGYELRVDFDNCTVTKGNCMPRLTVHGCPCSINPHGQFPIAGSTVTYLMTNFFFNEGQGTNCCWAKLNNIYVTSNGSVYNKMEVCTKVCEAGCHPDQQLAKGKAFAEWTYGFRADVACSACDYYVSTQNNRCQFNCMGARMVNGYYTTDNNYELYDISAVRGDTDYAPFDVALGKVCLRDGIRSATGSNSCHASAVVVGNDWIVQLCNMEEGAGCYICAKLAVYGVNSSCGS
jgi:hypothetical protein